MREVFGAAAGAHHHALVVIEQRVELAGQRRDFLDQALLREAHVLAVADLSGDAAQFGQRPQPVMHLGDQYSEPQCDQHGQGQCGALPETGNLGIQLAAVGGDHDDHRCGGARQGHLLGQHAQ